MANLQPTGSLDRPMSVQDIVRLASSQKVDPYYSMSSYFRSAQVLVKQASIYEHEGNDQMAYFLLYRYANLILDDLTHHPQAKDPEHKQAWAEARKAVSKSLAKMEVLRPRINQRYERYTEARRIRDARLRIEGDARSELDGVDASMRRLSIDGKDSRNGSPARLDPVQHQDMAVVIARRQMRRNGERRQSSQRQDDQEQDLSTSLLNIRRRIDRPQRTLSPSRQTSHNGSTAYKYPTVPPTKQHNGSPPANFRSPAYANTLSVHDPPQRPPKDSIAPLVPSKPSSSQDHQSSPSIPPKARTSDTTSPTHQFSTPSHLESGTPLRTIFLPSLLRRQFLTLAQPNTTHKLETLGLLAGTLSHNALFITHLLLPPQTSTSDTCEMIDESVLWAYIDEHEQGQTEAGEPVSPLMVLGWIHTHPTQTCFMSSRDLHSHVWYQIGMAESIAVVCSPRDDDWGVFRLTDPPGVQVVKTCKQTGIFHPHEDVKGGLYTDCLGRPGHVVEVEGLEFETVDLRDAK